MNRQIETDTHNASAKLKPTRLTAYILLFSIGWTIVIAASLRWNLLQISASTQDIARNVAQAHFDKDLLFRKWNTMHGGVYVPRTEKTPANPCLDPDAIPERDITTTSGKNLTLMNPSYMIRQIYELAKEESTIASHITSLNPIRKENKADSWEAEALQSFQDGSTEESTIAIINGERYVRLMRPLITKKPCLKCHADQGLKAGDIRGGMSISIPLAPLENISKNQTRQLVLTHFFFWFIGLLTICLSFKTLHKRIMERKQVAEELERQKEHFRLFYERAPISYQALDADGRLLNVNGAWLAMLGYDRNEAQGRLFSEFLAPEHTDTFNQQYEQLKTDPSQTSYLELTLRSKDGGVRFVLLTSTIINDDKGNFKHTQCTLQDVTDRTRAEQNLEKLRRQQEQILNSAGEGIYGLACDGTTTFVNPAAARLLGWSQDELIGKPHHTIVHYAKPDGSTYPLEECPIHAAIQDGQLHHGTGEVFWRRDGSPFPAEFTSTPIIEGGVIKGAVVVFNDISARHEAETALREQRNLFETILASTSDMIALKNRDSEYLAVNAAFCKNIGKTEEEIIGKTDLDLFPAEAAAVYQKEDREVMASCTPCFHDMQITQGAEQSQWLHITKTPVVDDRSNCVGLLCSIHDITSRKQAEEILENNEARFRGLFDNMNSGAAVFKVIDDGKNFIVIDFNQAAERIEKLSREQILGKNISDIFPNIDESGLTDTLRTVWRTGLPEHNPPTFYQDDRISGWREHHIYKLPSGELVVLFDDVTQRKRVEEELRQAQKLEAIGTLAGGIAHDFNNILTAIIGYSQLMLYDAKPENKNYPLLKEVLNASKRATNLVNQILTFSRQTEKERKPIEIQPVIKEALKLLRGTLPSTIEIVQEIAPNCRMIMADPVQIHQILMNLCTNAYHAMRKDGGTLEVRLEEAAIETGFIDAQGQELAPGPYLRLSIRDSGTGMDEETITQIFAPYFTTKEASEGTGLGLSTVLGLARSYNGSVTAESTLGKGSIFTVYFPIIAQEESQEASEQGGLTPMPLAAHILFVDDEETIVRLGKITMERLGCKVTALNSGVDALALFKEDPQRFDMVITDQTMPGLTGAALARQILAIRPELPIIMATGYSETINEEQAQEIGIRELLMKPLDLHDFERVIIRNLPQKS